MKSLASYSLLALYATLSPSPTPPTVLSVLTSASATLAAAHDGPHDDPINPAEATYTIIDPTGVVTVSVPTGPIPPAPTQTGCPTVTATRELCTTCPVPACLGLATLTQSCGCPSAIPTVYLDFPCADNCKGVWCSTSYDVVTATGECSGSAPGGPKPTSGPGFGNGTIVGTLTPPRSTSTSTSTSTFVQANAAGRMAVPRWMGLF
jgi:hypothetical protein